MNIGGDLMPPELQMPLEQEEDDETQGHPRVSRRKRDHEPSSLLKDYYVCRCKISTFTGVGWSWQSWTSWWRDLQIKS